MKISMKLGFLVMPLAMLAAQGCAHAVSAEASPQTPQAAEEKFVRMDTNRDGKVIVEEFVAAYPNLNREAFAVIDRNGNGAIDRPEWLEFLEKHSMGVMPRGDDPNARMNNIPGDPLIPPPDSADLPLVTPPNG